MRIAHLIMAYKNPVQLERLIRKLDHFQFDIYIHLDKKINAQAFDYMADFNRVFFIENRVICNWGGFSFVRAISNSVREILSKDENYEYINLISAQDYPIKTNDYIYNYIEKHRGLSFISYDKSSNSDWWNHAVTRYELYHFTDINIKGRYLLQGLLNRYMPKRRFPVDWVLYGSAVSSWWTITTDCARYIVNYLDNNSKLMNFMKFTWAADEFLYTSIIMNSPFRESTVNNNLRYIEWEEGKPNPRIFKVNNLESLKTSEQLFARKFDTDIDINVLDELDKYLDHI